MIEEAALARVAVGRTWVRRRDRRVGLTTLLAAIVRTLGVGREPLAVRAAFETSLRRAVPVRDVRIHEMGGRFADASHVGPTRTREAICYAVPTADSGRQAVLEAVFEPSCGLDEWDFQTLGHAAHLASLVLEIERGRLTSRLTSPAPRVVRERPDALVGSSASMRALDERIERVAATDFTALIEGESGTGKELVARQIHDLSRRRHGPFVAVNCAALVETLVEAELFGIEDRTATGVRGRRGKFEHADGGTLFLDEVSDLSVAAQAKLLRALQDLAVERVGGLGTHRVDVRIIAASNRPLAQLVERRLFRTDLFYRVSGIELYVPPLRERRDDILVLARHFLDSHRDTRPLELSAGAADALMAYDWPGNVRELERLIERAVALCGSSRVELDDLPPAVRSGYSEVLKPSLAERDTMRAWGSRYARLVLERCGHNKRLACRALGISYHTLQAYLRYRPPAPHAERHAAPHRPEPALPGIGTRASAARSNAAGGAAT